jgi:transposase
MLGKKEYTPKLMYNISLESLVPEDDYYRKVEEILDLRFVYKMSKEKYGKTGNPSLDPVVFFKIMLYGYLEGITSDRKLVRRISDSLSARLFIGYDIDEELPWHSTISRTRQHLGESIFEEVFNYILKLCVESGLVSGTHQSVDSTFVRANASLDSLEKKSPIYSIEEYSQKLKEDNARENEGKTVKKAKEKASNNTHLSKSDPDSRIAKKPGKPRALYYKTHCTVDEKIRIITDVLTTYANRHDSTDLLECVQRSKERLYAEGLRIKEISADKGYYSGENLRGLENRGIIPYIPHQRHRNTNGGFDKTKFKYDKEKDCFICPDKKELHYYYTSKDGKRTYIAKKTDCKKCTKKSLCTSSENRRVTRSKYAEEHQRAEKRIKSINGKKAMRKRKINSESIFAEGKTNHGLSRFNCRKLTNVRKSSYLIAGVMNLKRLIKEKSKTKNIKMVVSLKTLNQPKLTSFFDNIILFGFRKNIFFQFN